MMPMLAGISAALAVILHFSGVEGAAIPMLGLTLILGIIGLISPGKEDKTSGRVFAVLCIVASATPFIADALRSMRQGQLERARALQTAPMYATLDTIRAGFQTAASAYHTQYGVYPEFAPDGTPLPYIVGDGSAVTAAPLEGFTIPPDPFVPGRSMRWAAVGTEGVMLVSAGQDGVVEHPLPGPAMDGLPYDPLAPFAALGVDLRTVTYDPTNGSLGLGDIVMWSGTKPRDEVFKRLDDAWTTATSRSPLLPPPKKGEAIPTIRQSDQDAKQAKALFLEGKELAALMLAARAVPARPPNTGNWTAEEYAAGGLIGIVLYRAGHFRMAADALGDHLELVPNDVEAHIFAGAASYLAGDAQRARLHYLAASQIDPQSPLVPDADISVAKLERGEAPVLPPITNREPGVR